MNHEMRRAKQRLPLDESLAILEKGSSGVLALWDGEEPYAVPLSYVYHEGKLYFHCARAGRRRRRKRFGFLIEKGSTFRSGCQKQHCQKPGYAWMRCDCISGTDESRRNLKSKSGWHHALQWPKESEQAVPSTTAMEVTMTVDHCLLT